MESARCRSLLLPALASLGFCLLFIPFMRQDSRPSFEEFSPALQEVVTIRELGLGPRALDSTVVMPGFRQWLEEQGRRGEDMKATSAKASRDSQYELRGAMLASATRALEDSRRRERAMRVENVRISQALQDALRDLASCRTGNGGSP